MTIDTAVVAGIATTAGVVIAGTTSALLVSSQTEKSGCVGALFTQSGVTAALAIKKKRPASCTIQRCDCPLQCGVIGAAAGPVSAVFFAFGLAIGVIAAMQVFDHEASVNQLNALADVVDRGHQYAAGFEKLHPSDSTGLGLFKIQSGYCSRKRRATSPARSRCRPIGPESIRFFFKEAFPYLPNPILLSRLG